MNSELVFQIVFSVYMVIGFALSIFQMKKDKIHLHEPGDISNGTKVVSLLFFPSFFSIVAVVVYAYLIKSAFKAIMKPVETSKRVKEWWSQAS